MQKVFILSVLFFVIASPVFCALTDADLNKIRLIIKEELSEELKPIRADIVTLKTQVAALNGRIDAVNGRIEGVEGRIDAVNGRIDGVEGRIDGVNERIGGIEKMMTWLMVIIGVVIGLPQVIMMWRIRKERIFEKQIEALAADIETLKQQRIVQP